LAILFLDFIACINNYMGKIIFYLAWLPFLNQSAIAQDSLKSNHVSVNLWLDTYYAYDFSNPANHTKPSFIYNYNRHNEFNVNLALAGISYKDSTKKLNLGVMAGTYARYNLAAEPGLLRHIYEANAGIRISRKKELWVEAGIFPSHIGFESAVGKDCWTLTRSIMAENSPYYETGFKLAYKSRDNKWYLAAMVLNGWQKIRIIEGNNGAAFGTQLTVSAGKRFTINSSTYIGAEQPDTARQWRYFHNFYGIWQGTGKWAVIVGFDYGMQQKAKGSPVFNHWYTPVVIVRYQQNNWAVAARVEYYQDKNGVIVPLVNSKYLRVAGLSMNADRKLGRNMFWRLEGRWFKSQPAYFPESVYPQSQNFSITSSLSVALKR
jgi:Putative beta-barrel porin-2, OmpL-like. bbp2